MPNELVQYVAMGDFVNDGKSMAAVCVGSDGTCLVEIEENMQVREYAEVSFSLGGAKKLRDLLNAAIAKLEGV